MHFSTDQEDTTTVFRLKEERLDSQNASQLKAEFLILAQPDVETLIVDLTDVKYVDSAGLSALLLAERQMSAHHGDVRLVGVHSDVQSLLRLTQLDRVFPIFSTVDEALDAEPSFGDEDDDELPLAPGAPSVNQIKAGAIAAGGSFGAAALARIMMSPYEENLDEMNLLAFGDEEDFDDDDDDFEDDEIEEIDDEEVEDDEDLDEEDDVEDEEIDEDLIEDDEFEDDDFDDEELEEDEEEDY